MQKRRAVNRGSRIRLMSLCLCLLCPVPCLPAQSSEAPLKIRVDVDLVTVEVYALDAKGNPLLNLKKENFRLFEDGKQQEILSFDAVSADSNIPASALPLLDAGDRSRGKTILIIFDESTIPEAKSQRMHDAAAKFVREHMQPQDLFGVAAWRGAMRVLQNFTDDRQAVLAAIAQPGPGRSWGLFEDMLRSLEQINRSIATLKGQKSVLVFGRPRALYPQANLTDLYRKTLGSARKSNVLYYMVDPEPQMAGTPDLPILIAVPKGAESAGPPAPEMLPTRTPPPSYGLHTLAADSGGFSISDLDSVDSRLEKLGRQLSSYYVLGFQSSNQKHDGAFRKLRVTTNLKDGTLKYPPGYQDRRPVDALASSKQEQSLLQVLSASGTVSQLPVLFRAAIFYDLPIATRVLIAAKIRPSRVTLKKRGEQIGADLNIMGAAYAEDGSVAARFSDTLPVSLDRGTESAFRNQDLAYRNYFKLRPGKYRLKIAVSDEDNHLGATEQTVEVPAVPDHGLAFSSLIVAEQSAKLPATVQNLQSQLLGYEDPLLYSGASIQPSVANRLPAGSSLSVFFRIYDPHGSSTSMDLRARAKLLDTTGKECAAAEFPLSGGILAAGKAESAAFITLPFREVPTGVYQLMVEVYFPGSPDSYLLRTDLEFIK